MTEIMKRLEKKHAVICTQSKVDGRYKKINCAEEYKDIHIELKEMDWKIFNKICNGIPEEHVQIFLNDCTSHSRYFSSDELGVQIFDQKTELMFTFCAAYGKI